MPDASASASLSDLPDDELLRYGRELGLSLADKTPRGELLRRIRARQELLLEIDREALLEVVVWARRPVRASAGKEELAREIASIQFDDFDRLNRTGLEALARLRGVEVRRGEPDETLARRIRKSESPWERMRRRRRKWVRTLVGRAAGRDPSPTEKEYRFLPETGTTARLGETGKASGLVGGIARKIKGAADEYIDAKLDEVELRIDRKLDEIDARLAEWRDREVRNRLRIIKITLAATIVVGLISLGYSYVKSRSTHGAAVQARPESVESMNEPEGSGTGPEPAE